VIFDVGLDESDIRTTTDRVAELVRSRGGSVGRIDRWGRRTFAYELKHKTEGFYVFIEVVAEPGAITEVDRMLTLTDEVLRHRIIRQPETLAGRARPDEAPSDAQAS
jgi:small subunit ribosomal protein S6